MHASQVILAPVVSEKSYAASTRGTYTFRVHADAHKTQIRQAIEELFSVKVERVNVIKVQAKPKRRGQIKGIKGAGRMGGKRDTQLGLTVHDIDVERNLLLVKGAVPGPKNGIVEVRG